MPKQDKINNDNVVDVTKRYLSLVAESDINSYLSIKNGTSGYMPNLSNIMERFNLSSTPDSIPVLCTVMHRMSSMTMSYLPQLLLKGEGDIDEQEVQKIQDRWDIIVEDSYRQLENAVLDAIGYGVGYIYLSEKPTTGEQVPRVELSYVEPWNTYFSDNIVVIVIPDDDGIEMGFGWNYTKNNSATGHANVSISPLKFAIHIWDTVEKKYYFRDHNIFKEEDYNAPLPVCEIITNPGPAKHGRALPLYKLAVSQQYAIDMENLAVLSSEDMLIFPKFRNLSAAVPGSNTRGSNINIDDLTSPKPAIIDADVQLIDFPSVQVEYMNMLQFRTDLIYQIFGINRLAAGTYIPPQSLSGVALQMLLSTSGATISRIARSVIGAVKSMANFVVYASSERSGNSGINITITTDSKIDKTKQFKFLVEFSQALNIPPSVLLQLCPDIADNVKNQLAEIIDLRGDNSLVPTAEPGMYVAPAEKIPTEEQIPPEDKIPTEENIPPEEQIPAEENIPTEEQIPPEEKIPGSGFRGDLF